MRLGKKKAPIEPGREEGRGKRGGILVPKPYRFSLFQLQLFIPLAVAAILETKNVLPERTDDKD